MPMNEIPLTRDCEATMIPFGGTQRLAAGARVRILQSLGGTYTVANERGEMLRIEAKDADALGLDTQPTIPAEADKFSEKSVWDTLRTVYDPEIPVNIVDLGLIYSCQITHTAAGQRIDIAMTMTAPGCGMGDVLKGDIQRKLSQLPEVNEVSVEVVFDPPWSPAKMSEAAKLQLGLDVESGSTFGMY
ncbi:MAG: putative Fe-S cluster assembly protein SufT [Acidobacteria bacterium]|nr:putative Fe-S cluster assembly protein SufT [Acidobacteriota bacterium]